MSMMGLMMKMMSFIGKSAIKDLEKKSLEPLKVQEDVLKTIISENKDTEFGKAHSFSEIKTIEDYRKRVPLAEYDDFAPFIERMVEGEENVLVKEHINHFNKTSGTLGLAKYIPLSEKQVKDCGKYFALHTNATISAQIGYGWNDGKGINLMEGTAVTLESGATYGSASSVGVKRGPFKNISSSIYTSPLEAKQPKEGVITRYIHARFALAERNVTYIVATFSSLIFEFFTYIENNHEMLVNDIEKGTIDELVDLPDDVKASLMTKIKPDPERAAELRAAFAKGLDTPWAKRIWKNMQYMLSAGGANFMPYTEKIKNRVLGPDVHVFYLGVSASEGFFSAVYKVDDSASIMTPDCVFMEFIDTEDESGECLTIDQLKEGGCYEIIITNFGGLYRYRMHDVIEVVGFHNKTPLIKFKNRAGYAANIRGEKTSEAAVRHAVSETERLLGLSVYDYSIYPDTDANPSTYCLFLELITRPEGLKNSEIRDALEKQLMLANRRLEYHLGEGYLAPIRLITLQKDTYMLYRDVMVMKGVSGSQLKPINVIRNEFQRKFLVTLDEAKENPDI